MKNVVIAGFAAIAGWATLASLPAQGPAMGALQARTTTNIQLFGGRVVTGAPFSANVVYEVTQTPVQSVNFNSWHGANSVKLYRDGAGRVRQQDAGSALVIITDPVSNTFLTLDLQTHAVQKTALIPPEPSGEALTELAERTAARDAARALEGRDPPQWEEEELGSKTIEGLSANGTRRTRTIAAGQDGNPQPGRIVNEAWYSPDLKMDILISNSHSLGGQYTVQRLTDISRGEPDPSLFQVPPGYAVSVY